MVATTSVTILLTRPLAASERFAAVLRPQLDPGVSLIISPIIEIELLPIKVELSQFDTLVFTSQSALRAIAPHVPDSMPAYCVGEVTTQAARRLGLDAHLAGSDVTALAARIGDLQPKGRLLHLRGEHVSGDLAGMLVRKGISLHEEIVYRQLAKPLSSRALSVLLASGKVLLPIFSPRSGRLLMESLTSEMESVRIAICMSRSVASVLDQSKVNTSLCVEEKTAQSMSDAVLASIQ